MDYDFPWDGLITRLKFHDEVDLAAPLAELLAEAVGSQPGVDLVVPVALAAPRLQRRGFNQAWELARRVARALDCPSDAHLLQRPIDRPPQAGLDRSARLANLEGVYMVDPARRALILGRRLALVDDVYTTGATLQAASQTLLRAGAASVQVWVVARTAA